jgi:lipoprotein-releasing system ATP-binding protein
MIVELNKVCKTYSNTSTGVNQDVLNDISISIHEGEAISIIGPSGSGKSTLLNIIGTIDSPTTGTVKFRGEEINNFSENILSDIRNKHIGFIFQSHYLLPQLNILDNVLLPTIPIGNKKNRKELYNRAIDLLNGVNLSEHLGKFPNQLSGGECQRVAVVRALINKPELILADEPTGSLDNKSAENIGDLLKSIQQECNITLVVVTHSLDLANSIGNIYSLSGGNLTHS